MAEQDQKSENGGLRFPWKTMFFAAFMATLVIAAQWGKDYLHDQFNLGGDYVNLICVLASMFTTLVCLAWWFFLSGVSWRLRIVSAVLLGGFAYGAFKTVRIVNGGNIGIQRIEFLPLQKQLVVQPETSEQGVDLALTSVHDFPGFRGPDRTGVVNSITLADWSSQPPKQIWKRDVGLGWSAFSAVNYFAVTMEQRQEFECTTLYDIRTGELIWVHKIESRHEDMTGLGGVGPRSTPAIDEGKIYIQGATGLLECLDGKDGSVIWSRDITKLTATDLNTQNDRFGNEFSYEKNDLAWGRSGSPLIYNNLVIVPGGGPADGPFVTLFAFDKSNGKEVWRAGDQMIGYGSPSVDTLLGKEQILLVGESAAFGFDPKTGKTLWTYRRRGKSSGDANCSQVTVVSEDKILLTKGYRTGGELLQMSVKEGQWEATRLWKNPRILKTKFNSPVLRDGFTYSISDGYLECSELETKKRKWFYPNINKGDNVADRVGQGQLMLVDDKLIVLGEEGSLYLIAADPEGYRQLGVIKNAVAGVCWNNLCLFDDYLLIRSDKQAACYQLGVEKRRAADSQVKATASDPADTNSTDSNPADTIVRDQEQPKSE